MSSFLPFKLKTKNLSVIIFDKIHLLLLPGSPKVSAGFNWIEITDNHISYAVVVEINLPVCFYFKYNNIW
ncbi:hypothetical protein SDC9_159702 [bioreactor metagenome]|uniref:Uncharacterized protein n=1 Tax=bioreactor metagenome TaxID=1076179 RepID=A0A645FIW8_9ZZZZ